MKLINQKSNKSRRLSKNKYLNGIMEIIMISKRMIPYFNNKENNLMRPKESKK